MPVPLSVCMIVRNEEAHLARCLDSVRDVAAEIVIVDTGSTDSTVDIAKRYGASSIPFDFGVVDFAAARNHALAHARHQWVLMLDADEVLDPSAIPILRKILAQGDNSGYFLERLNCGTETTSPFMDYVVRLFPNHPRHRYRGRVHETIDASIISAGGKLRRSGIRLHHSFSADRDARRRKNHRYIEILKEEIAACPEDTSRLDFLAAEYHQLEMFEDAAAVAEQIARLRPGDARAHLFAGIYHLLYVPDFQRARADFNRALELRPGYPEAQSFLQTLDERERPLKPVR